MKYSEYQVWYHVYTAAITSLTRRDYRDYAEDVAKYADSLASFAVDKFKTIEDMPAQSNLDIQGLVDKVMKDSNKKK